MNRIAVIGAGVSGLACAWRLREGGADPVVFESEDEPGGWVRTERIDGFQVERGPAALRGPSKEASFLRDVGLLDEIVPSSPATRSRYLVQDGRPVRAPMGPPGLVTTPLLSAGEKLRLLAEPFVRARHGGGDESVEAFFRRRFGDGAARLTDPLMSGIFAGNASELSVRSALPALARWEQESGSVVRGAIRAARGGASISRLYAFPRGLGQLPATAAEGVGAGRLRTGVEVQALERREGGWAVDGEAFDAVVLALPAWRASALLAPTDEELARLLAEIEFVGVVVVSFAYDRSAWTEPWEGFGILSPRSERYRMLGCLLESSTFPHRAPEGQVLLRVLAGGAHDPGAAAEDEETLVRQFRDEVRDLLGPDRDPRTLRVWRYERCLPQYRLGHADRVAAIDARLRDLPGLRLTGNSYRGISVPDCIADGEATARSLLG